MPVQRFEQVECLVLLANHDRSTSFEGVPKALSRARLIDPVRPTPPRLRRQIRLRNGVVEVQ